MESRFSLVAGRAADLIELGRKRYPGIEHITGEYFQIDEECKLTGACAFGFALSGAGCLPEDEQAVYRLCLGPTFREAVGGGHIVTYRVRSGIVEQSEAGVSLESIVLWLRDPEKHPTDYMV
jgi:hypothetical protein